LAYGSRPFPPITQLISQNEPTQQRPLSKHPWRRIVKRCLEPDSARRYATVSEIAKALAPSHRWRQWTVVAAVLVAAVVGAAIYPNVAVPPQENLRLAVLPFDTSATDRALSDGLLDSMSDQLRHLKVNSARKLTVIPWADAVRNKADTPEKAAGLL